MKILLIVNSKYYIDDLSECKDFEQVQTYFIKKNLEDLGAICKVHAGRSWMGEKKVKKSSFEDYKKNFDENLFSEYENILFTGAIPAKLLNDKIKNDFKERVRGKLVEMSEYSREPIRDMVFFSLPDETTKDKICVGPLYDDTELYFDKQFDKLILHIDHHLQGRKDCHEKIINCIKKLESNDYFQKNWNGYEIFYHGKKINDIDDLDFYNRPPNIPFKLLSKIYRSSHVAFLSHRETLGLYPIEMAATGSFVAVLDTKLVKSSMLSLFDPWIDSDDFWSNLLPKINKENCLANISKVERCSYTNATKIIFDNLNKKY